MLRIDPTTHTIREVATEAWSGGAVYSKCETYRYHLWRKFAGVPESHGALVVCMLNPSTATEAKNDATIVRLASRARSGNYAGLHVFNLFAHRARDPKELFNVHDPIGPDNDRMIAMAVEGEVDVVCAWGEHGTYRDRDRDVLKLLKDHDVGLHAFKVSKGGHPMHPLYLPYTTVEKRWEPGWEPAA